MPASNDYRTTFIERGSEKHIIELYNAFGYKLESLQYLETDPEPWEKKIYGFGKYEIYDALGAYPSPARPKAYPFSGYVTMVFSLEANNPDYAYYYNVYRLYRRVQFDVFTCSERHKEQKRKMVMPLVYWVLYILIALVGAAAIIGTHFYEKRLINSGGTGVLFRVSNIPQYFEGFGDFLYCKAYVIGLIVGAAGVGLIILHVLWDLIYHGSKAAANKSSMNKLAKMRNTVITYARIKKYPQIDMDKLRSIENNHGIYDSTSYTSARRKKEDTTLRYLARKQKARELRQEEKRQRAKRKALRARRARNPRKQTATAKQKG